MKDIKLLSRFSKGTGEYLGKTPLTRVDVIIYFKLIRPWNLSKRFPGGYCQRCGVIIGENYHFKKTIIHKGINLCKSCKQDKISLKEETTPDIEDLERFNISINQII